MDFFGKDIGYIKKSSTFAPPILKHKYKQFPGAITESFKSGRIADRTEYKVKLNVRRN
jgi:hypothetical protein